ncbi:MAG: NTE family protein rssA [Hyphomicrobiales bacterium]|nr:MAG: NTE family protein rssA [Hyphomicrobiales bacterium]
MKSKIGLALGSGVARGWAHIGIIRALADQGIVPDIIAGTSIGALAGGCYAAGKLDELEVFARGLTRRRLFSLLDFSVGGSGLIKGSKLASLLDEHIGELTFSQLERQFIAVATEMATGHEIWLREGRLGQAMRASYALPGVFKPVKVNGRWLFDGALVNPIPVSVCRALGARVVIAVNLNYDAFGRGARIQGKRLDDKSFRYDNGDNGNSGNSGDKDESEETTSIDAGISTISRILMQQFFGKDKEDNSAPGLSSIMFAALNITQDRIARSRLAGEPPDVTLTPRVGHIGLFDFDKAEEAIACGRTAVERRIERTRDMLKILT